MVSFNSLGPWKPRCRFQSSQQLLQQCRPKQKTPLKTPQSPKVKSSRARLRSQCCPRIDKVQMRRGHLPKRACRWSIRRRTLANPLKPSLELPCKVYQPVSIQRQDPDLYPRELCRRTQQCAKRRRRQLSLLRVHGLNWLHSCQQTGLQVLRTLQNFRCCPRIYRSCCKQARSEMLRMPKPKAGGGLSDQWQRLIRPRSGPSRHLALPQRKASMRTTELLLVWRMTCCSDVPTMFTGNNSSTCYIRKCDGPSRSTAG